MHKINNYTIGYAPRSANINLDHISPLLAHGGGIVTFIDEYKFVDYKFQWEVSLDFYMEEYAQNK